MPTVSSFFPTDGVMVFHCMNVPQFSSSLVDFDMISSILQLQTIPMNNHVQTVISQVSVDTFRFHKTNKITQPLPQKWRHSTRSGPVVLAEEYPSRAGPVTWCHCLFIFVFPPCRLITCIPVKPPVLSEAWHSQRLLITSEKAQGKPRCSWENEWCSHGQFRFLLLLRRRLDAFLMLLFWHWAFWLAKMGEDVVALETCLTVA